MVYCSKCGSKNEDDVEFCAQCGASLKKPSLEKRYRARRKRLEDECFGLPHGGAIAGLIFGAIIILWGLSLIPNLLPEGFELWWFIIIIFGVLMVAGALYRLGRR
ncbi:MAG: zinc-ribbon domain-containing protein [Candidatus Bathyarchaeota archaeon]|nr:zinc-ribbon domain-containing protein [Candidatus Bathyarchaeota archaeon]